MSEKESIIIKLLSKSSTKEEGFNRLIQTYQKQLYWQIRELTKNHEDTDDVLQNVLVKIWRYIDNFKGDSKLSTWLYRIARNEAITFLNIKNKRKIANLNDENKSNIFELIKADEYFDSKTIYNQLKLALNTLPSKQKEVFKLRYFEEMKYKEIAKRLNKTEGSLKASYYHAVKKIEAFLKSD